MANSQVFQVPRMENLDSGLNPIQRDALLKLWPQVSDLLPSDFDEELCCLFLLKFLNVQNFNVDKAKTMIRECCKWREEHGVDYILEEYKIAEMYKPYDKEAVGHDKQGRPFWIFPCGRWDLKGMLSSFIEEDFILFFVYLAEKCRKQLIAEKDKKRRQCLSKHTAIVDVEGLDYSIAFWAPGWKLAITLSQVLSILYPDSINKVLVINVPSVLIRAFEMFKPLLNQTVLKNFQLHNADRSTWIPALLEDIDADQLPKHWGGTMVDPDGNPKCPSKVCPGVNIPKSCYIKSKIKLASNKCLQSATIERGGVLELKYDVLKMGSKLKWTWYVDSLNIEFMVHLDNSADLEMILPKATVESFFVPVEGEVTCLKIGTYVLTFDNRNFKLRPKSLWYSVEVIPPNEIF